MHTPNVLVGLDLNGVNAPAILARACQVTDSDHIEVVHVCDRLHPHHEDYSIGNFANSEELDNSVRHDADHRLGQLCDPFGITRHRVLEGKRADAIHEYAQGRADLVVVGFHGRYGIQTMMGSSSNAIVHATPCDVLAVHVEDGQTPLPNRYERVLVAVDLTDEAIDVMDHAMRIAKAASADVALCHVYSSRKEAEQRAQRQQLAQLGSLYGVDNNLLYSMSGRVAHEIHDLAKRLHADLIVVGTHASSGLERATGSMANAVLHGATCDSLSVRLQMKD